jgi:hypothetical protein
MTLFLFLLAVCFGGSLLVTSLIWIFFWMVGIFEVPLPIRKLLGIAAAENYGVTGPSCTIVISEFKGQAGIASIEGFRTLEQPWFRPAYPINLASASKSPLSFSMERQNLGGAHATSRN